MTPNKQRIRELAAIVRDQAEKLCPSGCLCEARLAYRYAKNLIHDIDEENPNWQVRRSFEDMDRYAVEAGMYKRG